MYSTISGVKRPPRNVSPVKRAHSLSPPRESFTKRFRRLSNSSTSPNGTDAPPGVIAGAILSSSHVLAATAGYERRIGDEQTERNSTAAMLVRSAGIAAAPAGFRQGRHWTPPTPAQKSGAKQVIRAIAEAAATIDHSGFCNDSPDADTISSDLAPRGSPESQDQDETPANDMPELNYFGYESVDDTVIVGEEKKDDGELKNIIDIEAFGETGNKVYMRALLDTCSASNFIREGKAQSTRQQILPYRGERSFLAASGEVVTPLGEIVITFHRYAKSRFEGGKTFQVKFIVVSDVVPFDVILGLNFCMKADVFQHGEFFCPILPGYQSSKERREQEERKAKQKAANEAKKAKIREGDEKKKQEQAQAKAGPLS